MDTASCGAFYEGSRWQYHYIWGYFLIILYTADISLAENGSEYTKSRTITRIHIIIFLSDMVFIYYAVAKASQKAFEHWLLVTVSSNHQEKDGCMTAWFWTSD